MQKLILDCSSPPPCWNRGHQCYARDGPEVHGRPWINEVSDVKDEEIRHAHRFRIAANHVRQTRIERFTSSAIEYMEEKATYRVDGNNAKT